MRPDRTGLFRKEDLPTAWWGLLELITSSRSWIDNSFRPMCKEFARAEIPHPVMRALNVAQ